MLIRLRVNGTDREVDASPFKPLADVLREDLGLTGTKVACGVGVCGLCTVHLNGEIATSCLTLAGQADGATVTTIEGLAPDGIPTKLQRAFIDKGGFQCGICTPGQIMAAAALLAENPHPSDVEIRHWMNGNLCRCTGYYQIVEAIRAAAE
jgi:carbon-monoxide dehydrogenase small subunit